MSYQALTLVQKEVREGRVTERPHGDLCIFKYSADCSYGNLWNDVNTKCRGIIFDTTTGAIVARPFDKFFNLGEKPQTQTQFVLKKAKNAMFRVTEKLDGSMVSIWFYKGQWHCSTPGSITSEQAQYAESTLLPRYNLTALPTDLTYVCELISPMDRADKVVEYGDRDELVMITAFENKWEMTEVPFGRVMTLAHASGITLVPIWSANYENFVSLEIPNNKEGYVISFEDGLRIKVKSIVYLRAFRLVSEFSRKHLMDYIEQGEYRNASQILPEAKRKHFDDLYGQVMTIKGQIELEAELWYHKCDPDDMKKSATILESAGPVKGIVFMMLRDKTPDQMHKLLWKIIRERFEG